LKQETNALDPVSIAVKCVQVAQVGLINECSRTYSLLTEIGADDDAHAFGLCDLGLGFPALGQRKLDRAAERAESAAAVSAFTYPA
jgi:hypothetical protein